MVRGLVIDKKRGNMLKIDRHKYVKLAYHGFKRMSRDQRRDIYSNNAVPHAWPATHHCCYWGLPGCLHLQPPTRVNSWAAAKPQASAATYRLLCHSGMHALQSSCLQGIAFCRVASWIPAGQCASAAHAKAGAFMLAPAGQNGPMACRPAHLQPLHVGRAAPAGCTLPCRSVLNLMSPTLP